MAVYADTTGDYFAKASVCVLALMLMSATFLVGCSINAPYTADRSDKQAVKPYVKPTKPTGIPPGSCPDCDDGGPKYTPSIRPSR